MNQIFVIQPYFHDGSWVFDDSSVGLLREPFVSGIPEMIDRLIETIPNAQSGFRLLFSSEPFPDYQIRVDRQQEEIGGYWYKYEDFDMTGWLCPALFKYFDEAPAHIYAQATAIEHNKDIPSYRSVVIEEPELMMFRDALGRKDYQQLEEMLFVAEQRLH